MYCRFIAFFITIMKNETTMKTRIYLVVYTYLATNQRNGGVVFEPMLDN